MTKSVKGATVTKANWSLCISDLEYFAETGSALTNTFSKGSLRRFF